MDSPHNFLASLCFLFPPSVLKSEFTTSDWMFEKIGRPISRKSFAVNPLLASSVGKVSTKVNFFLAQLESNLIAAEFASDFLLNADEGLSSIAG